MFPQGVALGAGVIVGCILGYAGLEFWAFKRKGSSLNVRRFCLYCLGVLVMFLARAACLTLFTHIAEPASLGLQALELALAYGVAFWVNYFFQAVVVFQVRKRI